MTTPDPRYPDGAWSADPRRPGPAPHPAPDGAHPGSDPEPDPDTLGAHAARPDDAAPGRPPAPASRPGRSGAGAGGSTPSDRPDQVTQPEGPPTTTAGGHVLGVLAGLGLTMLALLVLALGMSRILAGGLGAPTVAPDTLGIALVTVGALLVALVALLAIRSSAAPFTGGLVAVLVGAAYLFAPEASYRETVRLLATEQNRDAVLNSAAVATGGTFFVLGLVLLAAGNAASIVRRRGIEVGLHRGRTAARTGGER